jgi:transposase-like protein
MGKIKHANSLKVRIALEMIKGTETVAQICSRYGVHPSQAHKWKVQAMEGLASIFAGKPNAALREKNELIDELYKQVGRLQTELDWLKKKLSAD